MTLRGLIEAVERGEWPDGLWIPAPFVGSPEIGLGIEDAFHGSLDAAKRLHDALLPKWRVVIRQRPDDEGGGWFVRVESADFHAVQWTAGDHTTTDVLAGDEAIGIAPEAARAFLLAILRALEGGEG